jgi:ABC-type amino acid transport substrate-binding protein
MISVRQCLVLFSSLLLVFPAVQSANGSEARKLYFGIEGKRLPYTELVKGIEANGMLVDALREICEEIDAECHFVGGKPDQLLQDLQHYQLDALLVVDAVLLPDIDKLRFTSPLCRIEPVFLQTQPYPSIEAFIRSAVIGVQQDSLLHLYLLDEYAGNARLRAYPLLENGLFDLAFGRIDALFVDKAFLHAHIAQIEKNIPMLNVVTLDKSALAAGAMSVAIGQHNKALFNEFEQTVQNLHGGNPPGCADMLDHQYESTFE